MPTFAQGIPSFDRHIATRASGCDTHYGRSLSLRVVHGSEEAGHRFEWVGRRYEGAGHGFPFVGRLSE
jgi:hypothetical protein